MELTDLYRKGADIMAKLDRITGNVERIHPTPTMVRSVPAQSQVLGSVLLTAFATPDGGMDVACQINWEGLKILPPFARRAAFIEAISNMLETIGDVAGDYLDATAPTPPPIPSCMGPANKADC